MTDCGDYYNCKPPSFLERLFQKSSPQLEEQTLKKCLNIFDLTVQGVAHIAGTSIFIVTPEVIRLVAGPGTFVSYLISAAVLFFTVLAYMDLGARFKGIGNAYVYVYAALGEFAAALVGIFMMTEIALSLALYSVGFGLNLDKFILGGWSHQLQVEYAEVFLPHYLAENVNLMAIALIIVCCVVNCFGVKQVAIANMITLSYIILADIMYCVISLVYGSPDTFAHSTDPRTGKGGIFPYGAAGVITGAAIVVVAYNGFETTVSLSAEAKNSKRDVPLAVALSFGISTTIYVSITLAIVYLVPWYSLAENTGMPSSLGAHGLTIPKYILIGAILLAGTSIALCSLTTLARGLMVFSSDGLAWSCLSSVTECSQVPASATVLASVVTILFTLIFPYEALINMVSGGALLTFSAVCYTLIVITYTRSSEVVDETSWLVQNEINRDNQSLTTSEAQETPGYIHNQEWKIVGWMATFCTISTICVMLIYWPKIWSFWRVRLPIIMVLGFINILILSYVKLIYHIQPQRDPGFVCPGIPFVPAIGITLNLALFSALKSAAHFMAIAYIVSGTFLYFGYGYFHSKISLSKRRELEEASSYNSASATAENR
ncbi:hypothetical protein ACHWQZ_G003757 [Mnemiopsis leidyi]